MQSFGMLSYDWLDYQKSFFLQINYPVFHHATLDNNSNAVHVLYNKKLLLLFNFGACSKFCSIPWLHTEQDKMGLNLKQESKKVQRFCDKYIKASGTELIDTLKSSLCHQPVPRLNPVDKNQCPTTWINFHFSR